jgi:ribosomal-protein-alanine N-acetyltransferase
VLDDDGVVAGRLTLSAIVRGAFQSCSMGYWLSQDRTGRGYATQAVDAAVTLAFGELALHRIQAGTLVSNTASQNVLLRAGFERFGLAPRYLRIAGRWQDHILFQRLSDED